MIRVESASQNYSEDLNVHKHNIHLLAIPAVALVNLVILYGNLIFYTIINSYE